jgi:hypothetical protein
MRSSRFSGFLRFALGVLVCAGALAGCSNDPVDTNTMMFGATAGVGGAVPPAGAAGQTGVPMAGSSGTAGVPVGGGAGVQAGTAGIGGSAGGDVPVGGTGEAGMAAGGMGGTEGMAGMGEAGAGTGGGTGGAGAGGTGGSGERECVMGAVMASQVALIGDSYLDYGPVTFGPTAGNQPGGIQTQIEKRAVEDGKLMSGQHYRPYYVSGTRFLDGSIQAQWDMAKRENPDIKVVIMDGGGNDVLLGQEGCTVLNRPSDAVCVDVIKQSTDSCKELWQQLAADGVEDVVMFFYPNAPIAPGFSAASEPIAKANCDSMVSPRCTFVSTLMPFMGHSTYIGGDGIHPTQMGQVVIGDLIWDAMVDRCIAQ